MSWSCRTVRAAAGYARQSEGPTAAADVQNCRPAQAHVPACLGAPPRPHQWQVRTNVTTLFFLPFDREHRSEHPGLLVEWTPLGTPKAVSRIETYGDNLEDLKYLGQSLHKCVGPTFYYHYYFCLFQRGEQGLVAAW